MREIQTPLETIGDLMTVDMIALIPTDRVGRARDTLIALGIHALPVMEGNDAVGIVTSTDLVDGWDEDVQVTSIMTPTPIMVDVEASIQEAAETMVQNRTHHLLVTDDHEVVGIVSSFDLLKVLATPPSG